ncbi:MAG: hypothetical protein ACJA1R_000068 [Flavobacteriales bacterium]
MTHITDEPLRHLAPHGDLDGDVDEAYLRATMHALRASSSTIAAMTTAAIAERLAGVANAWLDAGSDWMERAVSETSRRTGYAPAMVEWSLRELLKRLSPASMRALVEAELGTAEPFQAPRNRQGLPTARGAQPPDLVVQVLAGTVPPVAIESIVLALLVRAPILVKTSSSEPQVSRLFLESLRELCPDLAKSVAVLTWAGGDDVLDSLAAGGASVVSIYGSDASVNAMMHRCIFPTRFLGYGHRVSFGIIGPAHDHVGPARLPRLAEEIALDLSAYDQRGCMSPHCLFVSADAPWTPLQVGEAVAQHGIPAIADRWPRGPLAGDIASAQQQARGVAEFAGAEILETESGLVFVHKETRFQASPGGRAIHIIPYTDTESLLAAVSPLHGAISTVGLFHGDPGLAPVIQGLGRLGARRFCRIGRMQRPIWLRDHDGRPRLGDWVEWTNVEPLY